MSTAIRSSLLALAPPVATRASAAATGTSLLDVLLQDQQQLTAVERFSRAHDTGDVPAQAKYYRNLIPATPPGPGQQYAFEVDLDSCTGCKACVTGCHSLNGLDDGEVWRSVGLLHGGTAHTPTQQTVTTACHHCLEPACLQGCPVKAYDKDPVTGIVKHLDDQCIGCQYCVFMCPYDAPKFSKSRGIVRKCDMCSDRLSHGEAPACVQSCPNQAITISLVDRADAIQAAEANTFLPGTPTPSDTLPTTVYKTERPAPRNLLPADFYSVSAEHAHPPLVVMLTLTQLSVGAFVLNLLVERWLGALASPVLVRGGAVFALALGLAALGASTLHLGRPQYAFRALLGLRTSWLSREILTFSMFAGAAAAYAAGLFEPRIPESVRLGAGYAAAGAGIAGVFSSVRVYAATRRAHWRGSLTGFKFGLTTVVLGAVTVAMVPTVVSAVFPSGTTRGPMASPPFVGSTAYRMLAGLLVGAMVVKLLSELAVLRHRRDAHHTTLKRAAVIMMGPLAGVTRARFWFGALGGVLLPAIALAVAAPASGTDPSHAVGLSVLWAAAFALCLGGELLERYLFFAAAPASKMPGTFA